MLEVFNVSVLCVAYVKDPGKQELLTKLVQLNEWQCSSIINASFILQNSGGFFLCWNECVSYCHCIIYCGAVVAVKLPTTDWLQWKLSNLLYNQLEN